MLKTFTQFFSMFTSLFSAGEKAANSLVILASVGESMAADYAEEQAHERAVKAFKRKQEMQALTQA